MSELPRGTERPPPGDDERGTPGRQGQGPDERPMSLLASIAWSAGVTCLFLWLLSVLLHLRPGAQFDLVSTFGCQVIAYLLGLFGVLQVHAPRASIRDFLGVRRTYPAFYPLAIALGVALEGPIGAVYQAIERRWPSGGMANDELVRLVADAGTAQRIALGLILVVLGPALEEVFFRGALTGPLRRRYGAGAVVATTAALFAIAHFEPQKFLPIGLFGLALGFLRVASGSLLPSVLLHATYNAIPFLAILGSVTAGEGAETGPSAVVTALVSDAPLPAWLVAVSSAVALGLMALAYALGSRAGAVAHAKERDTA
jgi:uncharacterized protein